MNSKVAVEDLCKQQGVQLRPEISSAAEAGHSSGPSKSYEPGPCYAAVAQVGQILLSEPDALLADKTLVVPPNFQLDASATALVGLINDSLCPVTAIPPVFNIQNTGRRKGLVGCIEAEPKFRSTIETAARPHAQSRKPGCEIFVDASNEPILLRKSHDERSTLTLQQIVVDGIALPPGSIVRMTTAYDEPRGDGLKTATKVFGEVKIEPVEQATDITFSRLSIFTRSGSEAARLAGTGCELDVLVGAVRQIVQVQALRNLNKA